MLGKEIRFGHGLVSPRRVERPAAPPTRPGSLGNELLGVRLVLVCRRVHAFVHSRVWGWCSFSILELSWGGGLFAPSYVCSENVYLFAFWEGGSLRPLMSARKMCICSHKNGKGILTYYRGGVLVGDGNRVGDLWPAARVACAAPPQATTGELGLDRGDARAGNSVWSWPCLAPSGRTPCRAPDADL